jgi:hypothetical protein
LQWAEGRLSTEEQTPLATCWSFTLEIFDHSLTNVAGQWQAPLAMSFAGVDKEAPLNPINIIQPQIDNFVSTQTKTNE